MSNLKIKMAESLSTPVINQNCLDTEIIKNAKYENEDVSDIEKHIIVYRTNLEERLQNLQRTMCNLKNQLQEERQKWKMQLDEIIQTSNNHYQHQVIDDNWQFKGAQDHLEQFGDTLDHKETADKYQEAILRAQAEKKANLRRQITLNNYKRQLLEVENMCNLELMRVKQNVQCLQPLRMIASEWNFGDDNVRNKNVSKLDEDGVGSYAVQESPILHIESSLDTKLPNELNSTIYTKMHYCSLRLPLYQDSTCNVWHVDDEIAGTNQTNPTTSDNNNRVWYSAETLTSTNVNKFSSPF